MSISQEQMFSASQALLLMILLHLPDRLKQEKHG